MMCIRTYFNSGSIRPPEDKNGTLTRMEVSAESTDAKSIDELQLNQHLS